MRCKPLDEIESVDVGMYLLRYTHGVMRRFPYIVLSIRSISRRQRSISLSNATMLLQEVACGLLETACQVFVMLDMILS